MIKWRRAIHTHYSNVDFLLLLLYYNYVRCNHLGKLGERYTGAFWMIFAPSCEYNYFKIKGSNKQTTANIILNSDRMLSSVLSTLHPFFFFFLMLQATHVTERMRCGCFIIFSYTWGNWGLARLRKLYKVTRKRRGHWVFPAPEHELIMPLWK